jgi:Asp-tRNA(Asn)/Glu-tRNA(Gln) amidotransferase A subunit family amidase
VKRIALFAAASFAVLAAHPDAAHVQRPDQRASNRPERSPTRAYPLDLYEVTEKTIPELQDALTSGAVTSRQLVTSYLARIAAYDQQGPRLNAMIALNPRAAEIADALDLERSSGRIRSPLHGIPVVVKDNYETVDMPTTGGSIALAGFMTNRDAFQVQKLREAGAVIIGKTNLHELARGITTVSSISGQTRNPYELSRNPGGSSGGTGAAVAASFAAAGMGSDTCGSIRIPSANNDLFGLRPTMGLSSRQGIIPLSHTQDVGGPLARDVTDLALMLDATVGTDPVDDITHSGDGHRPASYRDLLKGASLSGVRIGIVKSLFGDAPEDAEGGDIVRKALEAMHNDGASIVEAPIPTLEAALQGSSVINAEFKFDFQDYLARYPNAPVHSLTDILERGDYHVALEPGFKQSNAVEGRDTEAYRTALRKRGEVLGLVVAALKEQNLDALAYPVLSRKPAMIGEPVRGRNNCQVSASAGLPAISIPAGFTADGLPIGVELLGPAWSESRLLSIAYAYEQATHPRRPPSTTPPLVDAKGPVPSHATMNVGDVQANFVFDTKTSRLSYEVSANSTKHVMAAALHRGAEGQNGPIVQTVFNGSAPSNGTASQTGEITLPPSDREALVKGDLYLAVRSTSGIVRAQLTLGAQADPFLGIWELNLAKSSITRGSPPRREMVVNVPEPGGFKSTLSVVTDRSTSVEIHHYVFDGNFHQTEASDPRELSFKRVNQRTIDSDTRRNGQITVNRRFELSEDGKTMTVTASGTTGGGQKYANDTRVYERK